MTKVPHKLALLIGTALLMTLVRTSGQANAQWPPFEFRMTPSFEGGQITYRLRFSSQVDWAITDITFKIPLPDGTRFLEAGALSATQVSSDGEEVTFFTAYEPVKDAYFTLEVTDPGMTVFTTRAWVSWRGDQPGDYLTKDVSINITLQPLNWEKPPQPRLQLEAVATVADDLITYDIYPQKNTSRRMWDVRIAVPLPEGTTFLSAEAPAPFVTGFDGQNVIFSTLELGEQNEVDPLSFVVTTKGTTTPFLVTHAWATWKNSSRGAGQSIPAQEGIRSGDIVVQPHSAQRVVSDMSGDVPFSNYDLKSVALQHEGRTLRVTFYTVGDLGPVGQPLQYIFYIDKDCRADSGKSESGRGVEYRVRYRHTKGKAFIQSWDEAQNTWSDTQSFEVNSLVSENGVAVWVPYDSLGGSRRFCWVVQAKNGTEEFDPSPPTEHVPDSNHLSMTEYEVTGEIPAADALPSATPPSADTSDTGSQLEATPPTQESNVTAPLAPLAPSALDVTGKLAVPLGDDTYAVHIFSMPEGQEIDKIENACQPNFRLDGSRLLFKRVGGEETLFEYDFADGTEKQVSDAPIDSHPFYDPWGNRMVYGNLELTDGADSGRPSSIFVECDLPSSHEEIEPRCRGILRSGVMVPVGQLGAIWGTHPVWAANGMIAYQGCNSWGRSVSCGIYMVSATCTQAFGGGCIPRQLTHYTSDIPSDTKGDQIAFMSRRTGNWEVYLMNLDGSRARNISDSPDSDDGLPTISPDGNWIAFVSDRDGQWAVWVVSVAGGPARKLFDLPGDAPWDDWTNERISWGA